MADFCKECSIKMFGEDFHDLAGLIPEEKVKEGFGATVLCEGCGPILVNHEGLAIKRYASIEEANKDLEQELKTEFELDDETE